MGFNNIPAQQGISIIKLLKQEITFHNVKTHVIVFGFHNTIIDITANRKFLAWECFF